MLRYRVGQQAENEFWSVSVQPHRNFLSFMSTFKIGSIYRPSKPWNIHSEWKSCCILCCSGVNNLAWWIVRSCPRLSATVEFFIMYFLDWVFYDPCLQSYVSWSELIPSTLKVMLVILYKPLHVLSFSQPIPKGNAKYHGNHLPWFQKKFQMKNMCLEQKA